MFKIAMSTMLLLSILTPALIFAQITFEGCVDFRGIPVASVMDQTVQDVAMASYASNGAPVIIYNPIPLNWVSHPTRLFFYAHECAHHALGHLGPGVMRHPLAREQEADCWGIRELVSRRGLLSDSDIGIIQQDIARFGRGDWTHLPGPQRAINLRACLRYRSPDSSTWETSSANQESEGQSFCEALKKAIDAARKSFRSMRGSPDGTGDYIGKFPLPGTERCIAWADGKSYSCDTVKGSESDASRKYQELAGAVEECLGPNWKRHELRLSSGRVVTEFDRDHERISLAVSTRKSRDGDWYAFVWIERK